MQRALRATTTSETPSVEHTRRSEERANARLAASSTHVHVEPRHLEATAGDIWQAHALALAEQAHLAGTAQWTTAHAPEEPLGSEAFAVQSISQPWLTHTVLLDGETLTLHCDCAAGAWGKPCKHAGAVVSWLLKRAEAIRPRSAYEQLRERANDEFWMRLEGIWW